MIFLNFKTYQSGSGDNSFLMAKIADEVSEQTGIKINLIVQPTDIRQISSELKSEVWAQKIDAIEYGAHTGMILPEAVKLSGAVGTVLNHSECRFNDYNSLALAHKRAKDIGLKTLIFAKDIDELERLSKLKPDFISYEPPSLIGSKDKSVASEEPDIISQAVSVSKLSEIPLIVGAGVHSVQDVLKCVELGALGIAIASDIMTSDDPKKELFELASAFKK